MKKHDETGFLLAVIIGVLLYWVFVHPIVERLA